MAEIYIDKQQVLTPSDINGGGINLLPNTNDYANDWGLFKASKTSGFGLEDTAQVHSNEPNANLLLSSKTIHCWANQALDAFVNMTKKLSVDAGTYTLSFVARDNGGDNPSFNLSLYSDYTDTHGGKPLANTPVLTHTWKQYAMTFKIADAGTYGNWRIGNLSTAPLPNGSLYFANFKLEKGPTATPWDPSPLDLLNDIQALKSKLGG